MKKNKTIIYIGGYKSQGHKFSIFKEKINSSLIEYIPNYDLETPKDIQKKLILLLDEAIKKGDDVEIIGSSTGGMTALLLFEKYNIPMYLINPLLAKEQFFDDNYPVNPVINSIYKKLLNIEYTKNNIKIFLGTNDKLLNPKFTEKFAKSKKIELIFFEGDHVGIDSLKLITELINK